MMKDSAVFLIFTSLLWTTVKSGSRYGPKPLQCPNNATECAPFFKMNMTSATKFNLYKKEHQEFKCPSYGKPPPNITWYMNGTKLDKTAEEFSWTAYNLKADKHQGNYTCVVCNELGCINHTFQVHISTPNSDQVLKILQGPTNATVKVGSRHYVICKHNKPTDEVTIEWYRATAEKVDSTEGPNFDQFKVMQKDPDKSGDKSILEIPSVGYNDSGWYTCGVLNQDHKVFQSGFLKVISNNDEAAHPNSILSFSVSVILAVLIAIVILFLYHRFRENNPIPSSAMRQYIPRIVVKRQSNSDPNCDELKSTIEVIIERHLAPADFEAYRSGNLYYEFPKYEEWEFPNDRVRLIKTIGEGNFGKVYQAEADGILQPNVTTAVAVKMLKDGYDDQAVIDLVSEIEIMKDIGGHKNIINLLGCSMYNGNLMVIMEYAALGSLQHFLRTHNYSVDNNVEDYAVMGNTLSESTLLGFAVQVAEAMEFLASKKCIHRDLAARNVLVTEDYVMKVADFGLARNVRENEYYRKLTNTKLPIKWLAPESLNRHKYTTQSDVWSFGILLWEIMTMGSAPYPTLPPQDVVKKIMIGYRMEKPELCSIKTYKLMLDCWSYRPQDRPTFASIVEQLTELINNDVEEGSLAPVMGDFETAPSDSDSEEEYIESSLYNAPLVQVRVC